MAKENLPTISVVRNLLRYEPDTGKLFWLPRGGGRFDKLFAGKEAFTATDPGGYKYGSLQSHTMRAHVVAWALAYGKWPDGHIDHENGIREDNRLKNLSLGTLGNSVAGLLGGGLGGQILGMLGGAGMGAAGAAAGGMDIGSIIGSVASGGVGGGALMAIIGVVKNMMAKK